ncbi:TadE/TadG family type IV pilus assembly protein [Tabrizicola fusiformis]|uniref:TadE/TadG family type IV pilus assembly protein n=1 Tax=Tabrizicola sp. SY72 TaxID=2741673 RepID=UPI00240FB961|nr:pilus assembly protein TadG-related protein [Tabrizicola sp. SY72]
MVVFGLIGRALARAPQRQRASSLWRDESGNLVVFALCLFIAMTMFGGLAVDVMRYETVRTKLQNTLDRSTLAAASLTQDMDAETVVNEYFEKAQLSQYLTGVNVDEGINYRQVTADASAATNPIFTHLIGLTEMDAPGHSMAEQRITNVEIVLVLDVSGSMASNSRLVNLKAAAKEFIDTVLSSDGEDRISIAIVPFNGQVNLGPVLRAKFAVTDGPNVTNVDCVDLPSSTYNTLAMPTTTSMPMTAYADSYSTTNQSTSHTAPSNTSYATINTANVWCPASSANIVRLPSNDATTLKSQIDGLTAVGATSINAGMRWGTALIDPTLRTMYSQLITAGKIDSTWSGRPYDYTDDEAMKIIILMTDGEHFAEERINSGYRSGLSPIYKSTGDGNYSIRFTSGRPAKAGTNEYWVPHLCTSSNCTSGSDVSSGWKSTAWNSGSGVVQQTWPQVWSALRVTYVAWNLYGRALGTTSSTRTTAYNNAMTAMRTQTETSAMDTQLQKICTLTKNQKTTVYGIAFEAPSNGQTQIAACASSPAHYFNASGLQIKTAFRAIASNISQLRLIQ